VKIFGLSIVRDEEDVIQEIFEKALQWCTHIYVLDNGSTDATVAIVRQLEKATGRVTFAGYNTELYSEALRGILFNRYRSAMSDSDWWCRLDADEIYIDNPVTFLPGVPRAHHLVFSASFQFYFTEEDAKAWEREPDRMKSQSVEERMHYYICNHSEPRFFRHRDRLIWNDGAFPKHVGVVHPHRIRLKHYQYRSPAQIETRLRVRQETIARGFRGWGHDSGQRWQDKIVPASQLRRLSGRAEDFDYDPAKLAPVVEPPARRWVKRLLHGLGIWP
jgi:hypothetical protein